jgi:hypothetical protein
MAIFEILPVQKVTRVTALEQKSNIDFIGQ